MAGDGTKNPDERWIGDRHGSSAVTLWRRQGAAVLAWGGLFCVNFLGILPWALIKFPIVDLAETVYHARRLQLGYVPYRDTFTHHFLGHVLPFYLLGWFVPLTPTVLKAVNVCFNFASAVIIFLILREIGAARIAWLGAFLTVTAGWFVNWQGFAFNLQSHVTPLLSLLLLLIIRACTRESIGSYHCAAFICGVLLIVDQRCAAFLPILVVPAMFYPKLRRPKVLITSGIWFSLIPACGACFLWWTGAWSAFIEQTITFPLRYRNYGLSSGRFHALALVWFPFRSEPAFVTLALMGSALLLIHDKRPWLKMVLSLAFAGATLYAALGGRLYSNYFLVFAPAVLLAVSVLPWYLTMRSPTIGAAAIAVCAGLGFLSVLRPMSPLARGETPFIQPTEETIDAVAAYLRGHTSAEDRVLVWGYAPQIYVLSERFSTFIDAGLLSVAGANFASTSPYDQGRLPHMVRRFDDFLTQTPPKVIVSYELTRPPTGRCYGKGLVQRNFDFRRLPHLNRLRTVLEDSYQSVLVLDGFCDHAEVFVHQDTLER